MKLNLDELKCIRNYPPYAPYLCNNICSPEPCSQFSRIATNDWSTGGKISTDPFSFSPTNHMPWSLGLNKEKIIDQVRYILNYFPDYDNPNKYTPANTRGCTFHPSHLLDNEVKNIFI